MLFKASEMLLLNYEMSALEALKLGFVSKVFKKEDVGVVWDEIRLFTKLSSSSIQVNKGLIRRFQVDKLHTVNRIETDILVQRFMSDDFLNGVMEFLSRKNKKSKL